MVPAYTRFRKAFPNYAYGQFCKSDSYYFDYVYIQHNIIIDASIYGIGRGAGNLNTEIIAHYLNSKFNSQYNMDNLIYSFRQTALKIGRSCEACKNKYYSIRQRVGELPTLRRVLISRGFFMLSRHKLYIQGKNSARTEYQPKKLTSEQSENIIKNIG